MMGGCGELSVDRYHPSFGALLSASYQCVFLSGVDHGKESSLALLCHLISLIALEYTTNEEINLADRTRASSPSVRNIGDMNEHPSFTQYLVVFAA